MLHPDELIKHGFVGCKLVRVNCDQITNCPFLILKKLFEIRPEYTRYVWPGGVPLATKAFQVDRAGRVSRKRFYEVGESPRRNRRCLTFFSHAPLALHLPPWLFRPVTRPGLNCSFWLRAAECLRGTPSSCSRNSYGDTGE